MSQLSLSPGVYVEEVSQFYLALGAASYTVPVFLTSADSNWWYEQQQPVLIRSLQDYFALEGAGSAGMGSLSLAAASRWLADTNAQTAETAPPNAQRFADAGSLEACALRAYFANGGTACYLCPANQLEQIEALSDVSLVVQAGQPQEVIAGILNLCQPGSGRFALLDGPQHQGFYSAQRLHDFLAEISPTASAALYYPWLNARWALQGDRVGTYAVPPSAVAAGLVMKTDNAAGPWRAPGNLSLSSGLKPQVVVGDSAQQAFTSKDFTAPAVNMFREFPGKSTRLWGARTLTSGGPAWGFINVRRTFDRVERDLQQTMQRFLFEPNGPASWEALRARVENYLYGLFCQQAFAGDTPQSCYRVEIGLGSTMTQQDMQAGVMRMRIGLAVVRPAEFVFLEFSQLLGGATLAGGPALPEPEPYRDYVATEEQPRGYDLIASAFIGRSVGMSGDGRTVIFGGDYASEGMYIYQQRSDGQWDQVFKASGAGASSGVQYALSQDGAAAFIGIPTANILYFTRRTEHGWPEWNEWQQVVPVPNPPTNYGSKIAISQDGTRLAVYVKRATSSAPDNAGAVYLWYYQDNAWKYIETLQADPLQENEWFGYQMSFNQSGEQLVIFSQTLKEDEAEYIKVTTCTLDDTGVAQQISAQVPTSGTSFASLHPSGELIAIGNQSFDENTGRVQLYHRQSEGWIAGQLLEVNQTESDYFGERSIFSPDGNTLVVHAYWSKGQSGSVLRGKVWVFQQLEGGWVLKQTINAPEDNNFTFSSSLATDYAATRLFIGEGQYSSEDVKHAGRVWIYDKH